MMRVQDAGSVSPLARQKTWDRNSGTGILPFASLQHAYEHLGIDVYARMGPLTCYD